MTGDTRCPAVLLGAGRPARGELPAALLGVAGQGRVLDWQVQALAACCDLVQFVGGYRVDEIAARYPDLPVVLNPHWATTGAVGSLLRALPPEGQSCVVAYADTLFRQALVRRLIRPDGATVAVIDSRWRHRYSNRAPHDLATAEVVTMAPGGTWLRRAHGRSAADRPDRPDAELVGLLHLSVSAMAWLKSHRGRTDIARWDIPALLNALVAAGEVVHLVDCLGDWAELNAAQDIARFVLGTKAETLSRLAPMVRHCRIGEVVSFTVAQWQAEPQACLVRIQQAFGAVQLVVRSSALGEDGFGRSGAGQYHSELGVDGAALGDLAKAVARVIASYTDDNPEHQVLVQQMLADVAMAGVVMTRTLSHGAPYRVVNLEAGSGRTDGVTSGRASGLRTWVMHRDVLDVPEGAPPGLPQLLVAIREIETLVGHDSLDIEFIVDRSGAVHVVQVRPIAVNHAGWSGSDEAVGSALAAAQRHFLALQAGRPGVLGERAVFSRMSDWNPAEMIGTRPRRLAADLYDHLIMRDTWAAQRAQYGYRDLLPQPLMVSFAGHAYVDVRASLNSFLPRDLDPGLATRLVDHQLARVARRPELHDKLEFEVAITCLAPDMAHPMEALKRAGFTQDDCAQLTQALQALTARACRRLPDDLAMCHRLSARQALLAQTELPPLRRALWLLDDVRASGCLPFAHLARAAFVATAWLKGARRVGALDAGAEEDFLRSIPTVATAFREQSSALFDGRLPLETFLARFGHLRPGTYDITVPSYAMDPRRYRLCAPNWEGPVHRWAAALETHQLDDPDRGLDQALRDNHGRWDDRARTAMADALAAVGLPLAPRDMEAFMRRAIAGREWAKFLFTRSLSLALDGIAAEGARIGLDLETLSHVPLAEMVAEDLGHRTGQTADRWRLRADEERRQHELALGMELPAVLTAVSQLTAFELAESQANFIGSGVASGEVVCIDARLPAGAALKGKIALAMHADPGYDWLLTQGIVGLITAYGGANSHMAVRAAELGLPAAIGVGEALFTRLCAARSVRLDGAQQRLHMES